MKCSLLLSLTAIALRSSAIVSLFIPGCPIGTRTIDMSKLKSANEVMVYERGEPAIKKAIAPGSPDDLAIRSWLRSHPSGWQWSITDYAPSRVVRGDNFNLNFHKNFCILNYQVNDKGGWAQVTRTIDDDDPIPDVFAPGKPSK